MISEELRAEAKKIVSQMTNDQKIKLLLGKDFWFINDIPEFDLPAIRCSDGPHGLRTQNGDGDNMGIGASVPAICFPTAATLACSFDKDLMYKMGSALGEECLQEDVAILLGPGVNHKRSPLCGRNFEYFSEDPVVSGHLGAALVRGVQDKGIGTCVKHFACNSQERLRMLSDSIVDERALFEIYLRQFEYIVKNEHPMSIMPSYNMVNGLYSCENKFLLTDVARKKWGFDGAFISDWGAVAHTVNSYVAGMDVEMPGTIKGKDMICKKALEEGLLSQERLDDAAYNIVAMQLQYKSVKKENYKYDVQEHLKIAQEVAEGSIVLLKNDDEILPLKKQKNYAIIGTFAKKPRYQGAGSSLVNAIEVDSIYDAFAEEGIRFDYCDGYLENGETNEKLIKVAKDVAYNKDVVILVVGLTDNYESESFDRANIRMPEGHLKLIREISDYHPNVVVVLQCGSPIEMPWLKDVKGVVHSYLSGCQGGKAVTNILLGKVNPSGKLAETYPLCIQDTPCYKYYLQNERVCEYRESIFTGYRFYDTMEQGVLFPFGYGLSYTTFKYSDLVVDKDTLTEKDTLKLCFKVTNTGKVKGKEVVQVYISALESKVLRPKKELKEFAKIELEPGETKEVSFTLGFDDFAYYNVNIHDFDVESLTYNILVGASSRDIRLEKQVEFKNKHMAEIPQYELPTYNNYKLLYDIPVYEFEKILGTKIPLNVHVRKPYNDNACFDDVTKNSFFWRMIAPIIKRAACGKMDKGTRAMAEKVAMETPIRGLSLMSMCNIYFIDGVVQILNGHLFKGLHTMKKKIKK